MSIGGKAGWIVGCLAVAMAGIVFAAEIRSQQKDVVAGTRDSFNWNPLCKDSPYEMVLNVDNTDTKDFKVPSASGTGDGGANWTLTLEDTRNADFQKPIPSAEPKEDGKPYKPRFKGAFEGNGGGVRNGRGGGAPTWNLEGEYEVQNVEIIVDLEDLEVNSVRSGLNQQTLKFELNGNIIPMASLNVLPTTVTVDGEQIITNLKVTYVPSSSELNRPGSNTVKVDIDDMVSNRMDQVVNTFSIP